MKVRRCDNAPINSPRSLRRRKIHFNGQVWVGIMGRVVEKCQAVKRL